MMKSKIMSFLSALILLSGCSQVKKEEMPSQAKEDPGLLKSFPSIAKDPAHQVMVLGVFHFDRASDGSDVVAKHHLDISSKENQEELENILKSLKSFNPTRIAVEWKPGYQGYLDSLYTAYLRDTYTPGKNEIFQIGFKLAKELNLPTLYCVDNNPSLPESVNAIDDWDAYADSLGHTELWHRYDDENERYLTYMDTMQNNLRLTNYLKLINSPENIKRSKQLWTTGLINLGHGDQFVGADLLGRWYRRNARIYATTKNLVSKPEERILIIYGGAHKWILDELFESSPDFKLLQFNDLIPWAN